MKKIISCLICISVMILPFTIFVSAEEDNNTFYLVLGDSIAYGSGLKNPQDACYGKIVADTNGYDYSNHAVPGATSKDLLGKLSEESVISDIRKADIISISIGGNDFLKNNPSDLIFDAVLENDFSRFDETADDFYLNLCEIINIINSCNENAVILMQNLYNPQSGEIGELYQQGVDRINDAIERYDTENPDEIIIIDVETALNGTAANFAKDGIHPSAAGNELIAAAILDELYTLGIGASAEPVISSKGVDVRASLLLKISVKILTVTVKTLEFIYRISV